MPYIKPEHRAKLPVPDFDTQTPGELNYVLTKVCLDYIEDEGGVGYTTLNDVVGALECCKLEMYRRLIGPYEDKKIALNGDVYHGKKGKSLV